METPDISAAKDFPESDESLSFIKSSFVIEDDESDSSDIQVGKKKAINIIDSDSSDSIIELTSDESSEEDEPILRQTTINEFTVPKSPEDNVQSLKLSKETTPASNNIPIASGDQSNAITSKKVTVSSGEYREQREKVNTLRLNIQRNQNTYRASKNSLLDKGALLLKKYDEMVKELQEEQQKFDNMIVVVNDVPVQKSITATWAELQAELGQVQPNTFGERAMATLNMQKSLTVDCLEQLHGSLKTCPDETVYEKDPKGLLVELMPHQKHALAWLMWRENQRPRGGILADDMGLGKTLTMIALILKCKQAKESELSDDEDDSSYRRTKHKGGTLVICPASLMHQWGAEIKKHVKRDLFTVHAYHGNSRETRSKRLAKYDIVLTTYSLVLSDYNRDNLLFGVKWERIILDEAHQIRNHKSKTSIAICNLSARLRWTLTGTPVHNKELDLYSLLKFLRCSPFDDLAVWKRWVANKATGGQHRLNTVMSSLILRRTKQQLQEKKMLTCLPEKTWHLIEVTLEKPEMDVYQKVLLYSRTLFIQFLHQRAEKENCSVQYPSADPKYLKIYQSIARTQGVKKIKHSDILVLLLRLRQICCHPSLINTMLDNIENATDIEEDHEELDLLEKLNALNINDDSEPNVATDASVEPVRFTETCQTLFSRSNPVFSNERRSSKIKVVMSLVGEILPTGEKMILISQWTKLLQLISNQLKNENIKYLQLDGTVPVDKRMEIVDSINSPTNKVQILLLSLTAGGVGLNLIGANNLILIDLHWNPQLELQAQDRIYRVGQTKPIKIYKLMSIDTIEERIKGMQDRKLDMATELLTGARIQQNKLSLDDLKMLFSM